MKNMIQREGNLNSKR